MVSLDDLKLIAPEATWSYNSTHQSIDGCVEIPTPDGVRLVNIHITQLELLLARNRGDIVDLVRSKVEAVMGVGDDRAEAYRKRMHGAEPEPADPTAYRIQGGERVWLVPETWRRSGLSPEMQSGFVLSFDLVRNMYRVEHGTDRRGFRHPWRPEDLMLTEPDYTEPPPPPPEPTKRFDDTDDDFARRLKE